MAQKPKALKPRAETKRKMRPLTRGAFHGLLGKAITTPVAKPAPKENAKN